MRRIFFIAFLLISFFTSAQDQRAIDSILSGIEDARLLAAGHERDTTICRMYMGLGEKIYTFKPDSALSLWKRAQELAEEHLSQSLTAPLKDKYPAANTTDGTGESLLKYILPMCILSRQEKHDAKPHKEFSRMLNLIFHERTI